MIEKVQNKEKGSHCNIFAVSNIWIVFPTFLTRTHTGQIRTQKSSRFLMLDNVGTMSFCSLVTKNCKILYVVVVSANALRENVFFYSNYIPTIHIVWFD